MGYRVKTFQTKVRARTLVRKLSRGKLGLWFENFPETQSKIRKERPRFSGWTTLFSNSLRVMSLLNFFDSFFPREGGPENKSLTSVADDFFKSLPESVLNLYEKFQTQNRNRAIGVAFLLAVAYLFLSNLGSIVRFLIWSGIAYGTGVVSAGYLDFRDVSGKKFELADLVAKMPFEEGRRTENFVVPSEAAAMFLVVGLLIFLVGLGMACWVVLVFWLATHSAK